MASLCIFVSILLTSAIQNGIQGATIVDYLKGGNFQTLLRFLEQTGLNNTLDGAGAFTIFAPTDAAFSRVPSAELATLASNKTALTNLLKSHVITGFLISPQIVDGSAETSLDGTKLNFHVYKNGAIMVQNTIVADADHIVRNGVIHVINKVLLPPTRSIAEYIAENDKDFSNLFGALVLTNLIPTLEGGNFTVFAPNNNAFAPIVNALSSLSNEQLKKIMKFHVVPGVTFSAGLEDGQFLPTIFGTSLQVKVSNTGVTVNNASVIIPDIYLTNGVIHMVDKVIIPPGI